MTETTRAAIDYYHHLLQTSYATSTHERLMRAIEEGGMMYGGWPICDALRPYFLDSKPYEGVRQVAKLVFRGVTTLARLLGADPALRKKLDLTPEEEALVQMDPAEPAEVVGRFDGFLGPDGVMRFVEYNSMPGGIMMGDELRAMYAEAPIMAEFSRRFPTRGVSTSALVCDALLRIHHRKGGSGRPNLAILSDHPDPGDSHSESLLLLSEMPKLVRVVTAGGFEVRIVDPQQLRLDHGHLMAEDFRIDVALVANWPPFVKSVGPDSPFWRAVQNRSTWILNSAATAILRGSKSVFTLLSDSAYHRLFEPEVVEALVRHVPWTRRVRQTRTTYRDREIDLVPFMVANRDRLVLKPVDSYGAKGVVLGWQCDDAAWASALDHALASPYVVQERVPLDSEIFPEMNHGKLEFSERHVSMDPFVWHDDEIHGIHLRLSKTAILNIATGEGSTSPMLLIDD